MGLVFSVVGRAVVTVDVVSVEPGELRENLVPGVVELGRLFVVGIVEVIVVVVVAIVAVDLVEVIV